MLQKVHKWISFPHQSNPIQRGTFYDIFYKLSSWLRWANDIESVICKRTKPRCVHWHRTSFVRALLQRRSLNQTKYGAVVHQSTKILQAGILLLLATDMITSYDISTETHNPQEKGWTNVTMVTWNLIPYGSVKGHLQQLPRDKS